MHCVTEQPLTRFRARRLIPAMDIPQGWYTAGSSVLWGQGRTYEFIPVEALPEVPGPLDGSFAWLSAAAMPANYGMTFGPDEDEPGDSPLNELAARVAEATAGGLTIPEEFTAFMGDRDLWSRVPSCTSCYWELGDRLVPLPNHAGPERLLRFMNDQQSCLAWYLLLEPDGVHRVAVATPEFHDELSGDSFEDMVDPTEVFICAPSFEAFVRRFWIENAIWYLTHAGKELNADMTAYLEAAKSATRAGAGVARL